MMILFYPYVPGFNRSEMQQRKFELFTKDCEIATELQLFYS